MRCTMSERTPSLSEPSQDGASASGSHAAAHELVESIGPGRQRGEHESRAVGLRDHEGDAARRRLDLVGARADERVFGGLAGEQHLDAPIGAAVQHDQVAVLRRLNVDTDGGAAGKDAAGAEPHAHRPRVTRRRLAVGDGLEERDKKQRQHEARFATSIEY